MGFTADGDETAYRDEIQRLAGWCADNNLVFNTTKTKEMIINFSRSKPDLQLLYISGECVERVPNFKFLDMQLDKEIQHHNSGEEGSATSPSFKSLGGLT